MSDANSKNQQYHAAIESVQATIAKLQKCSDRERNELQNDFQQLQAMFDKATKGRVEIVLFGEISTGKSALINALIGRDVASVDVQGGWTKEVWGTAWEGAGHRIAGLDDSEIILVDTPGINEVGGVGRAELAETTARRADLILFVVDSDINDVEYSSLLELAAVNKPIVMVFNKRDLYSSEDFQALSIRIKDRVAGLIPDDHFVTTSAHPRSVEHVVDDEHGHSHSEWVRPEPDVQDLKLLILDVLEKEGLDLIALNAALYAADKSDRISTVRVQMRKRQADNLIWGMAATKATVVALTPGVLDIVGGVSIDALMIMTLSKVYGLDFSLAQARNLSKAIAKAAGVFALGELTSWGASALKTITFSFATPLTIIPQGAAAGFSSYIIGRAAQHYFEHGGSWGRDSAKDVVSHILQSTDKDSVLHHLKDEIKKKLPWNRHAAK
ncbi:MAG: GTP-binding protein [Pirellulaceae bacterium]|jgi:GTPase|nr:GTP-binding protein [Pirellulaceae bacterium]